MTKLMLVAGFMSSAFYFITVWISTFLGSLRYPVVPLAYVLSLQTNAATIIAHIRTQQQEKTPCNARTMRIHSHLSI